MKQGKTLADLAQEVQRISDSKKDLVADTRQMQMAIVPEPDTTNTTTALRIEGHGGFGLTDIAHNQVAGWSGIPVKYYNRMLTESPELLARNVNHWMEKEPKRRMVRTLDGNARAFLSDRYRILDNDELLHSILPVLSDLNIQIESSEVTLKKLYLKCTFPEREGEVKKGDLVRAGFVLSNSEVGHGSVNVQPLVLRLVCLNGATFNEMGMKKYHVGKVTGQGDQVQKFLKDDTLKAEDEAFMLKVRDTVQGAASEANFNYMMNRMKESTERVLEGNPVEAVEVVQKKFNLLDSERDATLIHLIQGGDLSQYGVANAVTRMSQDAPDYDRASDLERIGGKVFELPKSEWREIATAA